MDMEGGKVGFNVNIIGDAFGLAAVESFMVAGRNAGIYKLDWGGDLGNRHFPIQ